MKEQRPEERVKNFDEVPLGYTEEEALLEAARCLNCKAAPCVSGCPADVDIPGFIKALKEKDYLRALDIIKRTNSLPAVCGRVCPQEEQCEVKCVLARKGKPVDIGGLERFAADQVKKMNPHREPASSDMSGRGSKVAVIGSGPAGLSCAADLSRLGYAVTIFEALHKPGGVLTYGIPEFRLPKDIVYDEIAQIEKEGVELKRNYIIGKIKTIQQLRDEGFEAFFIATGAGLPYFLNVEGENLNGVYSANEFLVRVNLMKGYLFPEYDTPVKVGERVAVIGGGNVAMDSARSALRLGAKKVYLVYRRSRSEMPARIDEVHHAEEEGIEFMFLTSPVSVQGDSAGNVKALRLIKNELGEPDDSGRRRPVPVTGSEFLIDVDSVIVAIGNAPNPLLLSTIKELSLGKWGNIEADQEGRTSIEDIFAGGDIVTGAATVIAAIGAGKKVARTIDEYLKNKISKKNN